MAIIKTIKKHKKITVLVFALTMVLGFIGLFYHQNRAQAQNVTICDVEIPIGESMDTTYDFLIELIEEHQKLYEAIPKQVEQALKMARFANECDTIEKVKNNCKPICIDTSFLGIPACVPIFCRSRFFPLRAGLFDACPTRDINDAWGEQKKFAFSEEKKEEDNKEENQNSTITPEEEKLEFIYGGVIGASANIIALIRGEDVINEDGRLDGLGLIELRVREEGEQASRIVRIDKTVPIDENIRLENEDEDDTINLITFISRKLSVAREEFANCALTPLEILKFQQGEKMPKMTLPYHNVFEGKYHLPERIAECQEICGEDSDTKECFDCVYRSLLNYYCCH